MAMDDGSNKRQWPRQHCGAECDLALDDGMEIRGHLLDASRGGFKLRFENADASMAALSPPPRDIIVTGDYTKMHATVMWASHGLAGCRFYQHLSLDDVVGLMTGTGRFRIQVVPLAPPESEAEGDSAQPQSEPPSQPS